MFVNYNPYGNSIVKRIGNPLTCTSQAADTSPSVPYLSQKLSFGHVANDMINEWIKEVDCFYGENLRHYRELYYHVKGYRYQTITWRSKRTFNRFNVLSYASTNDFIEIASRYFYPNRVIDIFSTEPNYHFQIFYTPEALKKFLIYTTERLLKEIHVD